MKTSRQLAVEALCRMDKEKAWSEHAISSVLKNAKLLSQDKSFATALFYGTLTRRYTLDCCIKEYTNTPFEKLDTVIVNILRTAFYQLLYMDVPDYSAVDESVSLAKVMKKTSATSFVNGILRSFLRKNKEIPTKEDKWEQRAIQFSCPPSIIAMWSKHYGEEDTLQMLAASLEAPPTFLRTNTRLIDTLELQDILLENDVETTALSYPPHSLKVLSGEPLFFLEAFKEGLFTIQDISSQKVAYAFPIEENQRVLDSCAAPGGKAIILAQRLGKSGEVVACDIHPRRTEEIQLRKKILGLSNITVLTKDMTLYDDSLGEFDHVLCDAPCSGLGTIRRNPEIKYTPLDDFSTLPTLQYQLLETASKYCKKGGFLVYSTCTLHRRENENVVHKFLENHPNFQLIPPSDSSPSLGNTILLGEDGGDGFYIATFRHEKSE